MPNKIDLVTKSKNSILKVTLQGWAAVLVIVLVISLIALA